MTATAVLYDALGPRGRRRVLVGTVVAYAVLAGVVVFAMVRLADKGQLEGRRWANLFDPPVLEFMAYGLWENVRAAVVAMALACVIGALMALGRLSRVGVVRWATGTYVELFRALPLLLLILASAILFPRYADLELDAFYYLVAGLTVYNSAVLAEIFRAGILSLERGQSEAAFAVGLTYRQAMAFVVVPQAVRRMLPSIVSQLVTLFKDTSLGFIIAYEELLRRAKFASVEFGESLLQFYLFAALVFIAVNICLSRFARWLEQRQQRRYGGRPVAVGGVEDLAVLQAEGQAAAE